MKILFVTPYLPSPPHFGAQRRLEGLMRGLAASHEVSLLAFAKPGAESEVQLRATREYCRGVITVPYDVLNVDVGQKRLLQLRSLASRRSFESLLMQRPEFQRALDAELSEGDYDIVQVEFAQMAGYELKRNLRKPPRFVLDEHNVEYDLTRRTAEAAGSLPRKLYNAANWRKLRREERAAWWRFDGVALTSERDQQLVQSDLPGVRTTVVPNAVDTEAFHPNGTPIDRSTLIFLGAINYYPNTDGVLHFLDDIFPRLLELSPDAKFQIVGMSPPASVLERQSQSVEVTGFVEDPRPYLDRAAVVVVPLRIGGGTRFKIVEAMAMGKAIVSTRLGAEGIDVVHEKHALLADEPKEFAAQVKRLLDDPELAARLGSEARKLAEERYSWRAAVARLENFYGELGAARSLRQNSSLNLSFAVS